MSDLSAPSLPFRLGCPVWNCAAWRGQVYPEQAGKPKWLHWYSRMFNTVEGNSTFYGLPSIDVAQRWAAESVDGFRFSLKVPRVISHDARLVDCAAELNAFIQFARVLHDAGRLGPSFVQLAPTFGVEGYASLCRFVDRLPEDLPWAVELRHHDWFDQGEWENRINEVLADRNLDKVLFDSRPLYQAPPDDEIEAASQTRKPKTPVRQTVTASRPMLRLVGRNRIEMAEPFLKQWIPIVHRWVAQGWEPYVFTHAPDDTFAPEFARLFWQRFCEYSEIQAKTQAGSQAKTQAEEEGAPGHDGGHVSERAGGYHLDSLPRLPKPPTQMEFF